DHRRDDAGSTSEVDDGDDDDLDDTTDPTASAEPELESTP
ncbi:MAG: hypothetical protein JWQ43_3342, partial [Glaciihabitans sp.]|nr:hypothetical protein [Glaciihabitans sp.]